MKVYRSLAYKMQSSTCTEVIATLVIVSAVMRLVSPLCTPPDYDESDVNKQFNFVFIPFPFTIQDTSWNSYVPTIDPIVFEGTSTSDTRCFGAGCIGPAYGGARLADGDYGTAALNVTAVHAWNTTVSIEFNFQPNTVQVLGINLYFYNIPSRNIGLPYDTFLSSVSSFIEGNQDLNQNDNQLRSVTLIPTPSLISTSFTIEFRFSNIDKIDWLLLTEVEICIAGNPTTPDPSPITFTNDTVNNISPTNINSTISMTCSVENEGRFTWSWILPSGATQPPTFILDTGRTSVIELSQVTSNDYGEHQCHVQYIGLASDPAKRAIFNITLTTEVPPPITFTDDTVNKISPTSINPTISMTCSVENEGRFTWSWILPSGATQQPTFILNTGKTAVFELSEVSSDDSGNYQCNVDYSGFGGDRGLDSIFTITLNLEGNLQQKREIVPVTPSDDTITLRCQLYGYLPPGDPSITWLFNNEMLTNDITYTITNEVGDRLIQNGGSQTRPSLISALSINLTNNPVSSDQFYFCQSNQVTAPGLRQITLTTHHSSQQAVIGVLVACIVVLGIIFLVTILILLIKIRSVSKKTVNSSEEHYNMENVEYEDPDLYRIQTPAKDDEHNIGFDENVAYGRSTAVRQ